MLKKLCSRCNILIEASLQYCDGCQAMYNEQQKQRHKIYKAKRNDNKEQRFYNSRGWKQMKQFLDSKYKGLCLYSYYIYDRIVPYDVFHHIVPIKEDWNMRLHLYNLIPLTNSIHEKIHKMYENDQERTQRELQQLVAKWNGFGE